MAKKTRTKKVKSKQKNTNKLNKKIKNLKSLKVGRANINSILTLGKNIPTVSLENNIDILNKKLVSETKFGGYPLDLLFGIIYLKKKHPTKITLPFDVKNLLITHVDDLRERSPFTFIGCIIFKCKEELIHSNSNKNKKLPVNSFELEFPAKIDEHGFKELILNAKKSGKRFTIIPLIIRWTCEYEFDGHANIIIFDFEKNTVERFEPYGFISSFTRDENKVSKEFNKRMKKIVTKLGIGLKYEDPSLLVEKGPQFLEENEAKIQKLFYNVTDPEGFCGAWSLWYADLRLSNPSISSLKLVETAISTLIDKRDLSMREFIRNYSLFLVKERYKFLREIGQKNPYNYKLGEQLLSLEDKKSAIASALKTVKLIKNKNKQ
jgi:hypothetical protein